MPLSSFGRLIGRIALDPDAGALAGRRLLQGVDSTRSSSPRAAAGGIAITAVMITSYCLAEVAWISCGIARPRASTVIEIGGDLAVGHRPGDRVIGGVEQVGVGDLFLGLSKSGPGDGHQRRGGHELENSATFHHATVSFWTAGLLERSKQLNQFLAMCIEVAVA